MQHIRDMKNEPGYQPNTRHCMYGQDADLIMLGLVSHEPHFTLLREIINFGFSGDSKNTLKTVLKFTKESDFQLLHLSVLREYLQIEFCKESTEFDLERTIDDFVFMTFLVGNDFLPHLNSLDIGDGAFDLLFETYKSERAKWGPGNYLTYAGEIPDPKRLEDFLTIIGSFENEILDKRNRMKRNLSRSEDDGISEMESQRHTDAELRTMEVEKEEHYLAMIEDLMKNHSLNEHLTRGCYYFEKLKLTPVDILEHMKLRRSYIEGLLWCLAYYYRGCVSWGWYFPYHYGMSFLYCFLFSFRSNVSNALFAVVCNVGPMLINLTDMFKEINFEEGGKTTKAL